MKASGPLTLVACLALLLLVASCQISSPASAEGTQSDPHQMTTAGTGIPIPPESLAVPYCPVCEMKFPPNKIMDTLTYEGKLYGFCSAECKASFIAEHMGYSTQ